MAGIAERVERPAAPIRYRCRQNVDYLDDTVDSDAFVDPICGMPVTADSPYRLDRAGRQIRFCCADCQDAYRRTPWQATLAGPDAPGRASARRP